MGQQSDLRCRLDVLVDLDTGAMPSGEVRAILLACAEWLRAREQDNSAEMVEYCAESLSDSVL
jgi:hypothetical protein